jgi:hypothetical protein
VVWQRFETLGHYQSSVSQFDLIRGGLLRLMPSASQGGNVTRYRVN